MPILNVALYIRVYFAGQRILSWSFEVDLEIAPIEAEFAIYLNIRLHPNGRIVFDIEAPEIPRAENGV